MSDNEFLGDQPKEGSQPTPQEQPKQGTESKSYDEFLSAIVNAEGHQKYKSVPDALIGAAKAQEHIQRLEQENASLRGLETKLNTFEEVLQRLETGKGADQPAAPKVEDTEKLILSVMEKRRAEESAKANRESVLGTIKSRYGEKTDEVMRNRAAQLGMSLSQLGELAARAPQAVLELFQSQVKGTPSVQGTVNTQGLSPQEKVAMPPANLMYGGTYQEARQFLRELREETERELGIKG